MLRLEKPTRLQDMAFHNIVRTIWQASRLPSILVDHVESHVKNPYKVRNIPRRETNLIINEVKSLKLPNSIKNKLIVSVFGLDSDVLEFADEMASNLRDHSRPHLDNCLRQICFDQENYINKRLTLLNVYRYYLSETYCTNLKTFESQTRTLQLILDKKRRAIDYRKRYMSFLDEVSEVFCFDTIWTQAWLKSVKDGEDECNLSHIQFADLSKNINVFALFYGSINYNVRINIRNSCNYAFHNGCYGAEVLVHWYHHVDREEFARVILRHFDFVFDKLITSWRYREYAVRFYEMVAPSLRLNNFKKICFNVCNHRALVFENGYQDVVVNVILKIWDMAPLQFREDRDIVYNVIPDIVILYEDADTFAHMVSEYGAELREQALANVLVWLVSREKLSAISKFVKAVAQSEPIEITLKKYLTKKTITTFLAHNSNRGSTKYLQQIRTAVKYICRNDRELKNFKADLLKDGKFISQIQKNIDCMSSCYCSTVNDVVKWCLEKVPERRLDFEVKNVKANILAEIRERFLDVHSSTAICFKPFGDSYPRTSLAHDRHFTRQLLKNLLTYNNFHLLSKYRRHLFGLDNVTFVSCIEEFLPSPEGIESVIGLITYVDNVEDHVALRTEFAALINKYITFTKIWLAPFQLEMRVNQGLGAYGNPNRRIRDEDIKLRGLYELTERELVAARRSIDSNYMIFRAVLRGEMMYSVYSLQNDFFTDFGPATFYIGDFDDD